jgi:APA family basic amino acid/polyamine antiporter
VFARQGFGDFVGFQTAWTYWIGAWAGVAAIGVALVGYAAALVPFLNDYPAAASGLAIVVIGILTFVNGRGLEAGGYVSFILLILKIVPLLIIGTVGFTAFDPANLGPANISGETAFRAIATAAALTLFSFIGLETATIAAAGVRNPSVTVPKATVLGTALAGVVYISSSAAVFGALPNEELQASTAPLSDAARVMFGSWAGPLVSVAAVLSCLGAMNGLIMSQGQVPLAAAEDGLAPVLFGRRNRFGAPLAGIVVGSILAAASVQLNYTDVGGSTDAFTTLLTLSAVATLVPYAFSAGTQLRWLVVDRDRVSVPRMTRDVIIAALALGYSVYAIAGAGQKEVYWGFLLVLVGIPIYVLILRSTSRANAAAAAAVER